jgi:hypothetical protein
VYDASTIWEPLFQLVHQARGITIIIIIGEWSRYSSNNNEANYENMVSLALSDS